MPATKDKHTDIIWTRVDAIVTLILDNPKYMGSNRSSELTKLVMDKFSLLERTAQRSIAEAKRTIRDLGKKNIKNAFSRAMMDREYLWQKTKTADMKTALEVVKDRDKLLGLYEERILVSGEINNKITFIENLDE